ncbi:hypothetical protein DFP73DRAFT_522 [Morchella snyderi]|nr:hypothetical protein DFP73DRAFT_522 [Morchella snyderi]
MGLIYTLWRLKYEQLREISIYMYSHKRNYSNNHYDILSWSILHYRYMWVGVANHLNRIIIRIPSDTKSYSIPVHTTITTIPSSHSIATPSPTHELFKQCPSSTDHGDTSGPSYHVYYHSFTHRAANPPPPPPLLLLRLNCCCYYTTTTTAATTATTPTTSTTSTTMAVMPRQTCLETSLISSSSLPTTVSPICQCLIDSFLEQRTTNKCTDTPNLDFSPAVYERICAAFPSYA